MRERTEQLEIKASHFGTGALKSVRTRIRIHTRLSGSRFGVQMERVQPPKLMQDVTVS